MDRNTYKLVKMIAKRERLVRELHAHDVELQNQLRVWTDTRPGAVGGGVATLPGATFILRQAGVLD